MQVRQVDPRDQGCAVDTPKYRSYFWSPLDGAWAADEWELDAADVTEAICWAEEHSDGRDYVLYAVITAEGGRVGLVRLYGFDPTDPRVGARAGGCGSGLSCPPDNA
jgi:hypothetical protein